MEVKAEETKGKADAWLRDSWIKRNDFFKNFCAEGKAEKSGENKLLRIFFEKFL